MDIFQTTAKPPTYRSLADLQGDLCPEGIIDINTLYHRAIPNGNEEHEARAGVFHPSSVGYCKRSVVWHFLGMPATDLRSKRFKEIVQLGHAVHDIVQGRLAELGAVVAQKKVRYSFTKEVRYDPARDSLFLDLHIGGTTDGILRIWTDEWEQRGVVEIKSQNDDRHKTLLSMALPYKPHLMQSHLYAFRFDCPIIWVWYYNKNNSKREVRPLFFRDEIFNTAIEYFADCLSYVERKETPPREEDYFSCTECVYRTACRPTVLQRKPSGPSVTSLVKIRRKKASK